MDDFDYGQLPVAQPGAFRLPYALGRLHLSDQQYELLVNAAMLNSLGHYFPTGRSGSSRSDQATHSRMLRSLEARGLVDRLGRPGSRRTVAIEITEAGLALLRRVPDLVAEAR